MGLPEGAGGLVFLAMSVLLATEWPLQSMVRSMRLNVEDVKHLPVAATGLVYQTDTHRAL